MRIKNTFAIPAGFFGLLFLVISCKKSTDSPSTPPVDTKAITGFLLKQSDNHFIFGTDSTAKIGKDTITLTIPGGTDLTKLIPTITYTGSSIKPGSGLAQDFTHPVTYTVSDNTGATKSFTVQVLLTAANELIIDKFTVSAYDLTTGQLRWNNPDYINTYAAPASDGKIVYSGNSIGEFCGMNAITGEVVWKYNYGSSVSLTPSYAKGVFYIPAIDENIYAVNATSGNKIWNKYFQINGLFNTTEIDNDILYFIASDNRVSAVRTANGSRIWQSDPSLIFVGTPATSNATVFASGYDSNVYALDINTGNVKWNTKTGFLNASPVISDGTLYIGSTNDSLYAIDATTGIKKWTSFVSVPEPDGYTYPGIHTSPMVANGVVYIGGRDPNLYAFDIQTGAPKWSTAVGQVGPEMIYLDGVIYTGSLDGYLYALNAATGNIIWTALATNTQNARFAIIAKDGKVYNPVN